MRITRRNTLKIIPTLALATHIQTTNTHATTPTTIYHSLDYCAPNNLYTKNTSIKEAQEDILNTLATRKIGTLNVMSVNSRNNHLGVRLTIGSGARYIDGNNQKLGYSWGKQSITLDLKTRIGENLKLFTTTATDAVTGETVEAAWAGVLIDNQVVYLIKTNAKGILDTFKMQDKLIYEDFWQDPDRVIQPHQWYTFYGDDFGVIEYWQ